MAQWPKLQFNRLIPTHNTLHMWLQIVGKFRLAQTPWVNHSWHATFYLNSRGLTTSLIPGPKEDYEVSLDFISSELQVKSTEGASESLPLKSMSISEFHTRFKNLLNKVGAPCEFHHKPNELPNPTPFEQQTEPSEYDPQMALEFWRALVAMNSVFHAFRTGFLGKVSPVHLFWGSFDLAVTRFSGRLAPLHPGGIPALPDPVSQEAYSHEVSSAGFWAGTNLGFPAFYSYAYPTPNGFSAASVKPEEAIFNKELGEFILPYDAVQTSHVPESTLMDFLISTYEAAASLGKWDRKNLECAIGQPRIPRSLSK